MDSDKNASITTTHFIRPSVNDSKQAAPEPQAKDPRYNPISDANFLSRLTFWWTRPIIQASRTKDKHKVLEISDLPNVADTDQCEKLVRDIEVSWDEEVSRYGLEKASFFRAVYKGVGLRYLTWSFLIFLEAGLMVFSPVALGRFLRYVTNRDEYSVQYGYGWAAGLVGTNLLFLFVHHHLFFTYWREGMRLRSIIQMMIFRKILTLSAPSLSKVGQGLLINMQGSDIVQIEDNVMFLLFIPVAILVLIACTAIIATYLDLPSALAAMGCIITLIPMQSIGTAIMNHFKVKANKNRDVRVKYVHEIMSSIRVVKMYGWEYAFDKKVTALRHEEMASVVRVNGIMGSILAYGYIAPVIAALFAFLTYTYRGGTLTPDRAFGTMSTIVPARVWMGVFAPAGFRSTMELRVIFNRLSTILKTPSNVESSYDAAEELDSTSATNMPLVELTSVTTAWVHSVKEMDNVPFILKDVSFSVKRGEIVAVIGCVGSGKSTLLTMLMHELPIRAPRRPRIHGRLAYVSQVPFMLTESVRFNIVFHREWDPEWYAKVCYACGLERDFNLWEYRDETLVGERGVTLSGGQRARLELARALYGRADIYLLDDPLSAVDASVGQHLFTEAIRGLMQDAAVVLVTHQKQFLPGVDRILVLDGGRVKKYGTFAELDPRCLDACDADNASDADKISPQEVLPTMPPLSADELPSATCENNKDLYSDDTVTEDAGHEQKCAIDEDVVVKEKIPEANVETRNTGSVSQSVYTQYLRSGFFDWMIGPVLLMIWFVVVTAPQAVLQVTDWWLSRWSIASAADQSQRIGFYAGSYGLLVLGTVVLAILRALFIVWTLTRAARRLHRRMLCSLLHTAMSFFDKTPSGQILNRFSQDMIILDDAIVIIVLDFFPILVQVTGLIAAVGFLNPWLFLVIVPLLVLFVLLRMYYVTSLRELKRLQATSRSPILSLTSQTITGLYTIRTSGVGPALRKTMAKTIDDTQSINFCLISLQRWLGIRLETLNVIFLIVFTFLSAGGVGVGGPGNISISITYIIQLLGLVQYGTRISAELEAYMTNVERVIAYTQLPPEEGYTSDQGRSIVGGKKKDATEVELSSIGAVWPHSGHIEFKDVSLRYAPEQALVLKNVTLSIPAQTKVGIVGRTGAGKSSLLAALFRLSPLEPGSRIIIDGTDINRIPLQELRSGLSIIPQEPLLFCASIWENLDPSKEYTEDDLWEALRKSRLHDYVRNLPGDLHHVVTESNFSIGQRHLLCLARALLRRSKVLIMDEATANIDLETDAVIQQCIRTCFADRTILTVAHRLDTIIDSDLIVTLEGGRVRAVGPPHVLLQDPAGAFTSLVTATGPQHEQRLRDLAAAAYGNKYNEGDK